MIVICNKGDLAAARKAHPDKHVLVEQTRELHRAGAKDAKPIVLSEARLKMAQTDRRGTVRYPEPEPEPEDDG